MQYRSVAGIVIGIAALAAAIVIGAHLDPLSWRGPAVGILTGIAAIVLTPHTTSQSELRDRRYLTLGVGFSLYFSVAFGFSVLGASPQWSGRLFPDGLESVALTAIPIAYIGWFIGYRALGSPFMAQTIRRAFLRPGQVPQRPDVLAALFLSTVFVRLLLLGRGGFGFLRNAEEATQSVSVVQQYASAYGETGVVILGFVVVAKNLATGPRIAQYNRLLLYILPIELLLGAVVAQKAEFLFIVIMVAGIHIHFHGINRTAIVATATVALLIIFPLTNTYRDLLRPPGGTQLPASEAPAAFVEAARTTGDFAINDPGGYLGFTVDNSIGRLSELERAAVSISTHDAGRPYTAPTTIGKRIAQNLVPRVLWPGKPIDLYGMDISRDYYRFPGLTSSSLSPVGDAYRHGGLIATVLLMGLLGGLTRTLDLMFDQRRSAYLLPLLLAALPIIRKGDLAGIISGGVRQYLLLIPILFVVFRVQRREPEPDMAEVADAAHGR